MPDAIKNDTSRGADTERVGASEMFESDLSPARPPVTPTSERGTKPVTVPLPPKTGNPVSVSTAGGRRQGAEGRTEGIVSFGTGFAVIAGPCAIESASQLARVAREVLDAGAAMLRGGIYKLRTSPDAFQGLGEAAFDAVLEVRARYGVPIVSEVVDPRHVESMCDVVDMFQIGTRNMFNYHLLREVGRSGKPVMLKRAFAARIDEWLRAADYIVAEGNENVVLCERGIRTFETATRNTLDISAVPVLKRSCSFPVVVDPSHACGDRALVEPLCLAAAAAGADGVLVEVHPDPDNARSDPEQSLDFRGFRQLMARLVPLLAALGRPLQSPARSAADAS